MSFATPGSRSANYALRTLGFIIAGASAALFALLAIFFWFFGPVHPVSFLAHWMQITIPGWPLSLLILSAVQTIRTITTNNTGRSWPWVLLIFACGLGADFLLKSRDSADHITRMVASAPIATIVYIFFFTRWFSGK
jgi:hypothetical protein